MSRRFDNRRLFIVLAGLLLVLVLTVIFKIPKERSTLKGSLVEIDTAEVTKIIIVPKISAGKPFEFARENDRWTVRQDNIIATPMKGAVGSIFMEMLAIKPQSLAARGKSLFAEYELTDSLGTRIKFLNSKGKTLADIIMGKFTYKQVDNPYGGGYGGNNIVGTSFVRLSQDDNIYAVDGFLAFSFAGGFNDWRDKSFLKCKKEDVTKVSFTLPADSSYTLVLKDSTWFAGSQRSDSAKTSNYLNSIGLIDGQDFADGFKPASMPEYQMIIEGNNLLNVTIKCFKGEGPDNYILNSSQNPDIYFTCKRSGIFDQLFKPLNYFL